MGKLFQEFYYWGCYYFSRTWTKGVESSSAILALTATQYFILMAMMSIFDRLLSIDSIGSYLNLIPDLHFLPGKWAGLLKVFPLVAFYWIDYRVIMHKTTRKEIESRFNAKSKRKRLFGRIFFWSYLTLSIFGSAIVLKFMKNLPW